MAKISDVLQESRDSYLNDPNASNYSDSVLLPKIRTAYNLMETALIENGIQCKNEEYQKDVAANSDEFDPLPSNFFLPIKMEERSQGSTDRYIPMYLVRNIDPITPGPVIRNWAWRLDRIFLQRSDQIRDVKLTYYSLFPAINTANDAVFGKAEQYLSAKTAALVYMFIEQSPTLAQVANEVAESELSQIINMQTKIQQANPVRRRPYLPFRYR